MLGRLGRWLLKKGFASQRSRDYEARVAKRAELRASPLPDAWRTFLERDLPQYRRLTDEQRAKLHGDVCVFVAEKEFVGTDGIVVDDRIKVLVGASAALLVLGRDITLFDHVHKIVICEEVAKNVGGLYKQMESRLDDEVIETWSVIELAWPHVERGFARADGQNTALHELAHAFDDADGKLDALMSHAKYERWRTLLHRFPLHHRIEGDMIITEVVGDADGPELFASATELFFERPHKLHDLDRELFEALREIYAFDPRQLTTP